MTTKIDGNNGVLQSYDYQVLTTGFSYTFATGITTLIAAPAGTLATGTITMPVAPADGTVITIESTQQVTAVSVLGNTGQTITGAPSQLIANQPLSFVYRLSNTTWYAMAGGAGRATALSSGTSVASTSGTSIDFTSIPSWAKRITVMLSGVSTNGAQQVQVQLGTGASPTYTTSGYLGATTVTAASTLLCANISTGFQLYFQVGDAAAASRHGHLIMTNISGNIWVGSGSFGLSNATYLNVVSGSIGLAAVLTAVRITTNGADTFDAGSINIFWE